MTKWVHHKSCPRLQFWDAGEWECPCVCPVGWPRRQRNGNGPIPSHYEALRERVMRSMR